jgi:Polyketide cyclase / dehydrase and lipid transport
MKNKYCISKRLTINSAAERVFSVLSDIESWNSWTKSITHISFVGNSKFEVGGRARVLQPNLPPAIWTITEIIENNSFTWQTKTFGVKTTAKHILIKANDETVAELKIIFEGILAPLVYKLKLKLTAQYLIMEINGLKSECEKKETTADIASNR